MKRSLHKKPLTIKNREQEHRLFNHRTIAAIAIISTLTLLLIGRLFDLQLMQHHHYTTLSKQNAINLIPVAPKRGLIYDRNGVLLANNIPVFSLMVTPDRTTNMANELAALQNIIPLQPNELKEFQRSLREHRQFQQVPLKIKLTEEQVAAFAVNQYKFPGFNVQADLIRQYPFMNLFAHAVGYVGRINAPELNAVDSANYAGTNFFGKTGLENNYETLLHGAVGYQRVETDAGGRVVRILQSIPPVSGATLYLTLNSQLQQVAEDALQGNNGTIVAINPNNGQILAMVSSPSFDPNLFVAGIPQQDYSMLTQDPARPLYDRAIHGLYSIGSTIKPFIGLEGLMSGAITPDYQLLDTGTFQIPGTKRIFHDWVKGGHGIVNLHRAIMISCDVYFYHLAYNMGIQPIDYVLHAFGFGQKTGVDLPSELPGTVPSPEYKMKIQGQPWYQGDTVNTVIGQGYSQATALQLANATAMLAMHGQRYKPTLVYAVQTPGKPLIYLKPVNLPGISIPDNYWEDVVSGMEDVIHQGTAVSFGKTPYTVAGKTGTAQVRSHKMNETEAQFYSNQNLPQNERNNSIFIAFAPVDHPVIALAVIIEHHPDAAARVARKVMDEYLINEKAWTPDANQIPKVS